MGRAPISAERSARRFPGPAARSSRSPLRPGTDLSRRAAAPRRNASGTDRASLLGQAPSRRSRRRKRALRSPHQPHPHWGRPTPASSRRSEVSPSQRLGRRNRQAARRQQPVGSRAAAWKRRAQKRVLPPAPPVSPLVYILRLLIVGVGLGVIAGTVLSSLDPSLRSAGATAEVSLEAAQPKASAGLKLSREMPALTNQLRSLIAAETGLQVGLMVVDPDKDSYVDLNGNQPFAAASTIKLPLLVALLEQIDSGQASLEETLSLTAADIVPEAGEMQFQPPGTQFSLLEIATEMIRISDNTATNLLIRRLGGLEQLNGRFRSWNLAQTQLNNLLPDLEGTNLTSPKDLVTLLGLIDQGEILSLRSRDLLFRILATTETTELLPQGLGSGAKIAHKTGNIATAIGDVGRITMPSGKQYLMMVMVQRPPGDARADELIRKLSQETYQFLESAEQKSEQLSPPQVPRSNIAGDDLELNPAFMMTDP